MKLSELLADIYTRLSTSEAVTAIIGAGKVFNINPTPPPAKGPYIVIGDIQSDEGRLLNDSERVIYFTLHLWSSYKGNKELISIEQAAEEAILEAPDPGGLYCFDNFSVFRDIEEGWMHGVLTFRAYIDRGF